MTRLIDAQDAFNVLTDYYHHKSSTQHLALQEALNKVPTADAQPVRHGKWNRYYKMHSGDTFSCNRCGSCFVLLQGADKMNFCPNCGADMRGEK